MPGINWSEISQQLGFAGAKEMWSAFYLEKKMSLTQLSKRFSVSPNVIREALIRNEIPLRIRGGPNNTKVLDLDKLKEYADEHGIAAAAKQFEIDISTVYKRLYYKQGLRKRPLEPEGDVPSTPDPGEGDDPHENR